MATWWFFRRPAGRCRPGRSKQFARHLVRVPEVAQHVHQAQSQGNVPQSGTGLIADNGSEELVFAAPNVRQGLVATIGVLDQFEVEFDGVTLSLVEVKNPDLTRIGKLFVLGSRDAIRTGVSR